VLEDHLEAVQHPVLQGHRHVGHAAQRQGDRLREGPVGGEGAAPQRHGGAVAAGAAAAAGIRHGCTFVVVLLVVVVGVKASVQTAGRNQKNSQCERFLYRLLDSLPSKRAGDSGGWVSTKLPEIEAEEFCNRVVAKD
jgi:hypothetical protein